MTAAQRGHRAAPGHRAPADAVFLKLYAAGELIKTDREKLGADKASTFTMKLKPGLIHYKVEFGTKTGDTETLVHTVGNLACGDAYLIQGQSNALATDTRDQSPPQTHDWIRSSDLPRNGESANRWYNPVWRGPDAGYPLGWWGMELAKRLVTSQQMPICIINGNTLTLTLKEPSTAEKISYLDGMNWSEDNLLQGANGIAALTFCDVPIESNP